MFPKLDLFPPSGEGGRTPTQWGPLERANLNHWTAPVRVLSQESYVTTDGQLASLSWYKAPFWGL
jgi:hypothetical protein